MEYIGRLKYDDILKEKEAKIVVFGAGKAAHYILSGLKEAGLLEKVVCICDNHPEQCMDCVENIRVISFEQAYSLYKDAKYIIYNKYAVEIAKQLIGANIKKIHYIKI